MDDDIFLLALVAVVVAVGWWWWWWRRWWWCDRSPRRSPRVNTVWRVEPYSRLSTTDMRQKLGVVSCFGGREGWRWVPAYTMWSGPRATSTPSGILIHPAVWIQYLGQKVEGCCVPPPFWGRSWSPTNIMFPGPRTVPTYQVAS